MRSHLRSASRMQAGSRQLAARREGGSAISTIRRVFSKTPPGRQGEPAQEGAQEEAEAGTRGTAGFAPLPARDSQQFEQFDLQFDEDEDARQGGGEEAAGGALPPEGAAGAAFRAGSRAGSRTASRAGSIVAMSGAPPLAVPANGRQVSEQCARTRGASNWCRQLRQANAPPPRVAPCSPLAQPARALAAAARVPRACLAPLAYAQGSGENPYHAPRHIARSTAKLKLGARAFSQLLERSTADEEEEEEDKPGSLRSLPGVPARVAVPPPPPTHGADADAAPPKGTAPSTAVSVTGAIEPQAGSSRRGSKTSAGPLMTTR